MSVSSEFKKLIKHNGLTYSRLAEYLGVSAKTARSMMLNYHRVIPAMQRQIADLFKTRPEVLANISHGLMTFMDYLALHKKNETED